jgi:hypothetical protein
LVTLRTADCRIGWDDRRPGKVSPNTNASSWLYSKSTGINMTATVVPTRRRLGTVPLRSSWNTKEPMVILGLQKLPQAKRSCATGLLANASWNDKVRLPPERRTRFAEIAFEFQPNKPHCRKKRYTGEQEKKWDDMYAKLCDYHKQYGHCKVAYYDESNEGLSKWVSIQRSVYDKELMDEKRRQRLEDLGFVWYLRRNSKTDTGSIASHVSSATTIVSSRARACSASCESVDESATDGV